MSEKEWYENIPAGGVLCKHKNGTTVLIKTAVGKWGFDMSSLNSHFLDELTPLTAAEMWEFMPWLDMDSAPSGTHILLIDSNGHVGSGFIYQTDAELKCSVCNFHPIKWLPLPKADK